MATDPKGVNIPITSTFDSSGTDAAQRELDQVKRDADAAASASSQGFGGQLDGTTRDGAQVEEIRRGTEATVQAQAATSDLTEAEIELARAKAAVIQGAGEEALKHLENARATKAYQDGLKQIELASKAMIGIQVAQELTRTLASMKDLVPAGSEVSSALDSMSASLGVVSSGMSTFIATGNPVLAVLGGLAGGIQETYVAWKDMREAQKIVETGMGSVQKSMVPLAEQHRELAQQIRADAIDKLFAAEGAAASKAQKEIESLNRVKAAQDQLAAAKDKADPNLSNLDRAANQVQRVSEAQQREMAQLKAKLADLENQRGTLVEAVRAAPTGSDDREKAQANKQALEQAIADVTQKIQEQEAVNVAELGTKIVETRESAKDEAVSGLTKAGQTLKDEIQREVDAAGAQASPFAKQALERAKQVLQDGQVTPEELDELRSIASQASQSTEALVNGQVGYFQRLMTYAEASKRDWQAFEKRLASLEEKN
jgi:hypothetical protein